MEDKHYVLSSSIRGGLCPQVLSFRHQTGNKGFSALALCSLEGFLVVEAVSGPEWINSPEMVQKYSGILLRPGPRARN